MHGRFLRQVRPPLGYLRRRWRPTLRRAVEQLEREHAFLKAVLRHMPVAVLIVEAPSGRIRFHNRQLTELLGQPDQVSELSNEYCSSHCLDPDSPLARTLAQGTTTIDEEVELDRGDGVPSVVVVNAAPIRDEAGRITAEIAVFQDVTERKAVEEQAKHLALHDPLTELPNRTLLLDRLGHALAGARRENSGIAVMLLDLDGFKDVNDTFGHLAGDQLLRVVAHRIASAIRASDTLARLGGDEFALIQTKVRRPADIISLADKVLGTVTVPFRLDGQEVHASASLGIAVFPQDGQDVDTLLKNADLALYRAKSEGRGRFHFFEPAMDETAQTRRRLERELRQALEGDELMLHYQLQLELATGRFVGVEALVRWNHPERGLVMPDEFIPLAEATGLIRPLGEWVLQEACRQARTWREKGWQLTMAVNLSPVQLRNGHLLPAVAKALKQAGLKPVRLELEITENVLIESLERELGGLLQGQHDPTNLMRELTSRGVRLAIDDFGVGYSSLAYLKYLPVQTIKVDRSFMRGVGEDADAEALLRAIVGLGHNLGKRLVAEGVEDERQLAFVRELGCEVAQGFHIARPQAAKDVEHLLTV